MQTHIFPYKRKVKKKKSKINKSKREIDGVGDSCEMHTGEEDDVKMVAKIK